MSLITTICLAFIIGYIFIAIESVTRINKAAIAEIGRAHVTPVT